MKKLLSILACVCLLFQMSAAISFVSAAEASDTIALGTPVTLSFSNVGDVQELTLQPAAAGDYTFTLEGDARVQVALLMVEGADNIYIGGGSESFTETFGAYDSVTIRVECVGSPECTKTLTVTAELAPEPDPEPDPDPDITLALNETKELVFAATGDAYRLRLPAPRAGDYTFTLGGDCQVFVSLYVTEDTDNINIGFGDQTFTQTLEDNYEELEVCVECVGAPGIATLTVEYVRPILNTVGGQLREPAVGTGYDLRFGFDLATDSIGYADPTHADGNYQCEELDEDSKGIVNGKEVQIVGFGTILTCKEGAEETDLTLENCSAEEKAFKNVPAVNLYDVCDGYITFTAVVKEIPEDAINTAIQARPYVQYLEDGAVKTIYGDAFTACVGDYLN